MVLYQGVTLVVPKKANKIAGFSVCVRTRVGTLAVDKSEGAAAFRLLNDA